MPHRRANQVARTALIRGMATNAGLACIKIATGMAGHSYALIADGIESLNDVFASAVVLVSVRIATKPADPDHPYGHGKAEQLGALFSALSLLGAAGLIAWHSIHNLVNRHHAPEWFTLPVLLLVIATKSALARYALRQSHVSGSTAVRADATHHRADALTSAAAAIGITIALIGGDRFARADDIAALFACLVIAYNGWNLLAVAIHENMDGSAPVELRSLVRALANGVEGVRAIEKLRMKKSGLGYQMDVHVQVDRSITVEAGHRIGHAVQNTLLASPHRIDDVVVHVEPFDERPPPA
jgi:cation diffusion facilitator family transporter